MSLKEGLPGYSGNGFRPAVFSVTGGRPAKGTGNGEGLRRVMARIAKEQKNQPDEPLEKKLWKAADKGIVH